MNNIDDEESRMELMKKLGLDFEMGPKRARNTNAIRKDVQQLAEKVEIEDELEKDIEKEYMKILEGMITGEITQISPSES